MKILFLADEESKMYWEYFKKEDFKGIDIIVSCGDLNPSYLSFLTTMVGVPLLYVHGNHDDKYNVKPPEGCICIEDEIYEYEGVRFLGLGGSNRYKPGKNQYTQKEMTKRVKKLWWKLKRKNGFDVLVTHSPAKGLHKGFEGFNYLLEKYKPKYFIHGHIHKTYQVKFKQEYQYNENTRIINGYEKYIFEYPDT